MARILERQRQRIINTVSLRLDGASDSRAANMVRVYCKRRDIPATDRDIADMATEAIRRRMVTKIKELNSLIVQLNDKVNSFHP